MNKPSKISKSELKKGLRKELFWDVDFEKLDVDKAVRLVMERVVSEGNLQELKLLFAYYGEKKISEMIVNIGFLDNKTLGYLSHILNIPKSKFKCYTKKPLNQNYWNY